MTLEQLVKRCTTFDPIERRNNYVRDIGIKRVIVLYDSVFELNENQKLVYNDVTDNSSMKSSSIFFPF